IERDSLLRYGRGDGGTIGERGEAELAHAQLARLLEVLAHVAGPVGDDASLLVPIPRVAAGPGGPGEARLQRPVARCLHLGPDLDRAGFAPDELLQRLADVGGLGLEVEDDRAARGV